MTDAWQIFFHALFTTCIVQGSSRLQHGIAVIKGQHIICVHSSYQQTATAAQVCAVQFVCRTQQVVLLEEEEERKVTGVRAQENTER